MMILQHTDIHDSMGNAVDYFIVTFNYGLHGFINISQLCLLGELANKCLNITTSHKYIKINKPVKYNATCQYLDLL